MKLRDFGRASAIQETEREERIRSVWWILYVATAIFVIVFVRAFVFQTFKIPSASMMPTLLVGDHIVVNRFVFGVHLPGMSGKIFQLATPGRGDVVVFSRFSEYEDQDADTHYIKRIVGVPGDEVKVVDYRAFVNGRPIGKAADSVSPEFHSVFPEHTGREYGPVKLADGQYFVLGDNLSNSRDSRFYGPIQGEDIEGRAEFIYWSWDVQAASTSVRWDRVGRRIR